MSDVADATAPPKPGRPRDQPVPDVVAAVRAMRSIASRRVDGPAADRMPEPELGNELAMVRYVRRHPHTSPAMARSHQSDIVDALTLVRHLRLGDLFEAEVHFAAAAADGQVPWRSLRGPLGVRTRQAVKAALKQRLKDRDRLAGAKAQQAAETVHGKQEWAETHRSDLLAVAAWLIESREGFCGVDGLGEDLEELEASVQGAPTDPEALMWLASDLLVLVGDVRASPEQHAPEVAAGLPAVVKIMEAYRTASHPPQS